MGSDHRPFRDEAGAAIDRAAHLQHENARLRDELSRSRLSPLGRPPAPSVDGRALLAVMVGAVCVVLGGLVGFARWRCQARSVPVSSVPYTPAPAAVPLRAEDDDVVAQLPCSVMTSLRSRTSTGPLDIDFVNAGPRSLTISWIDFEGSRVRYQVLPPGSRYTQPTYTTHPWIATDGSGTCVSVIVPKQQGSHPTVFLER